MKGIVLAGGTGSRLWPTTKIISKQLLPIYDKPMIYYPLSTLMLAGIREILIITTPHEQAVFKSLLGDGSQFGIELTFEIQAEPAGLAQAYIIGESFLGNNSSLMILGDNIFHGAGLGQQLKYLLPASGAHVFTYKVSNPEEYGVLYLDENKKPFKIKEKPSNSTSNYAVTGLYYFDKNASAIAKQIKPSERGELEITSVIDWYLQKQLLTFTNLSRGTAWLDTGNPTKLLEASTYVRVIEERTGLKIACLEEIAFHNKWISAKDLDIITSKYRGSSYGTYLKQITN